MNRILLCLLALATLSFANVNVSLYDQGTNVADIATGALIDGNLTVLLYNVSTGGTPIFNTTYTNAIYHGSWDVLLENISLTYGTQYWKAYEINSLPVTFNGAARLIFYSPLGDVNSSALAESINLSNATGYLYANLVGAPAASESDPLWSGNETAVFNETLWSGNYSLHNDSWSSTYNSTYAGKAGVGDCAAGEVVQNTTTSGVECIVPPAGAEVDPLWSGNMTSVFNETLWSGNYSLFNDTWSLMYNASYITTESDPLWSGNATSVFNETLWSGNYSLFNDSWSSTYNSSYAVAADCPAGEYVVNTTDSGVECQPIIITSTTYYPNETAVTGGANLTDNLTLLWYYDDLTYNWSEGAATDPLDVYINYTTVSNFTQIVLREYYLGSASHHMQVQLWDYDESGWESYYDFVGQDGFNVISVPSYDPADHISGGVVQMRLHHVQSGITSHRLYIDYAWLLDGQIIAVTSDLTGYAKYNFNYNNFNGSGNMTANEFFGDLNASYIQNAPWANPGNCPAGQFVQNTTTTGVECDTPGAGSETDPLWSGNFTSVYNETLWSGNYSLFNDSWSSTYNASYLTSESDPLWSGNDSSIARIGDCPAGQFVKNVSTGGVSCAAPIDAVWCYQESANTSNQSGTDDCIGLYYTGNYVETIISLGWNETPPSSNLYDGNWTSYAYLKSTGGDVESQINYTKPANSNSSIWQIKFGGNSIISNASISSTCWNSDANIINLKLKMQDAGAIMNVWGYCHNGTDYEQIFYDSRSQSQRMWEEGIWWEIQPIPAGIGSCPTGQFVQNTTNTGVECDTPGAGSETDPLWSANYTAHNDSWSLTYNATYDALVTDNQTWNETRGFEVFYPLTSNPLLYWNSTFADFNKTYADTLYATIDEPLWSGNDSTVARAGNCAAGEVVQNTTTTGVECIVPPAGSESDPLWSGNATSVFNETLWSGNYSLFNDTWSSTYNASYLTAELDPLWSGNDSSVARTGDCAVGELVQNITTTGVECMVPPAGSESDPLWSANYTAHNDSWSSTFNLSYDAWNKTYADTLYAAFTWNKSYADTLYATIDEPLWSGNDSTVARTGDCAVGEVVQNITTTGVECMVPPAGSESDPLWSDNESIIKTNITNLWTNATNTGINITNLWTNATNTGVNITNLWTNASNTGNNITALWTNASNTGLNITNLWTNATNTAINITNLWTNASLISGNITPMAQTATAMRNISSTWTATINEGIVINTTAAAPTCNAAARGGLWVTQGGAGVADLLYACLKNTGDTYNWVQVSVG